MCKKVFCFDLDDTLYKEIDFLKSGYKKVSEMVEKRYGYESRYVFEQLLFWFYKGENAFANLNEQFGIDNPMSDYLNVYRYHHPNITLSDETKKILDTLKNMGVTLGIITDGREITQKQKIVALGLQEWIGWDYIFINKEKTQFKPNHWSFDRMMLHCYERYSGADIQFYYIGDNPEKDFIAPNELGWTTIMLKDNGKNIHKQVSVPEVQRPQIVITEFKELINLIK